MLTTPRCGVHSLWRGLEQYPSGVAEQAVSRPEHDRRDDQRCDSVGSREAGGDDRCSGDRREDERGKIGEEVLEAALDVHRFAVCLCELPRRGEVDDHAEEGDCEDRLALGSRGRDESTHSLVNDQESEHEEGAPVCLGRENLGAPESECQVASCRPAHQSEHHE